MEAQEQKLKKVKVSVTVDGDVVEKLRQLAEKDDRPLSQYINIVLSDHLADSE